MQRPSGPRLSAARRLTRSAFVAALLAASTRAHAGTPVGDAYTYQGELKISGQIASGLYDFEFKLYDGAQINAAQISQTIPLTVSVSQGRFTAKLDFGPNAFNGEKRFLGIGVRPAGSGSFTLLDRQELTPAPYALSLALPMAAIGQTDAGLFPSGLFHITQSGSAAAVMGQNTGSGSGVLGYATGGGTAVTATAPGGTALRITGAIRATGAGVNTNTPAFIHLVSPASISGHSTFISNAMTNGDANAILIVTYNVNGTNIFANHPLGVSYDLSSGFWWIGNQDGAAMVAGAKYNVLVIKN